MILAHHLLPWHEVPIAVIDFETTGLDPKEHEVVQLAVVLFRDGEPTDRYCTLVNPGIPIPEEATAIHGIGDGDVKDKPNIQAAIEAAGHLLVQAAPAAYNAPFDKGFMRVALRQMCPYNWLSAQPEWPWLDPLVMVRVVDRFVKGKGRHKLPAVCKRHDIELDKAHDAASDAEATGRLLFKIGRELCGDLTLSELLRRQQTHAVAQEQDFQKWKAKQPPMEDEQ